MYSAFVASEANVGTRCSFKKDKPIKKHDIYLWETHEEHMRCFMDFSWIFLSAGKTPFVNQGNMSINGFVQGKHHQQCNITWAVCSKRLIS